MKKSTTLAAYKAIIQNTAHLFKLKHQDYGSAWRILRIGAFVDQIMIKAHRIRAIDQLIEQKVNDSAAEEFKGIVNYAIMALIQFEMPPKENRLEIPFKELEQAYQQIADRIQHLLEAKNHDYQESWRSMEISSMVDIILMKLLRIKQILKNNKETVTSEGIDAGLMDIVNYAVFCLILLGEKKPLP